MGRNLIYENIGFRGSYVQILHAALEIEASRRWLVVAEILDREIGLTTCPKSIQIDDFPFRFLAYALMGAWLPHDGFDIQISFLCGNHRL